MRELPQPARRARAEALELRRQAVDRPLQELSSRDLRRLSDAPPVPDGAFLINTEPEEEKAKQTIITACPHCGAKVGGGKFCPECGKPLASEKFCTNCGAKLEAGAKFCAECGTKQ